MNKENIKAVAKRLFDGNHTAELLRESSKNQQTISMKKVKKLVDRLELELIREAAILMEGNDA